MFSMKVNVVLLYQVLQNHVGFQLCFQELGRAKAQTVHRKENMWIHTCMQVLNSHNRRGQMSNDAQGTDVP